MSSWYKLQSEWSQHSDFVNIGSLVVFLVMHSPYSALSKPNSPRTTYDTVWPSQENISQGNYSPPSPNQKKTLGGASNSLPPGSSSTSPMSPRNLRASSRRGGNTPTYWKSANHHLNSIREKLPLLLRAVSLIDSVLMEHEDINERNNSRYSDDSNSNDASKLVGVACDVTMFGMDSLGLIIGGSFGKTKEVNMMIANIFVMVEI
jgi:hypothetical protein